LTKIGPNGPTLFPIIATKGSFTNPSSPLLIWHSCLYVIPAKAGIQTFVFSHLLFCVIPESRRDIRDPGIYLKKQKPTSPLLGGRASPSLKATALIFIRTGSARQGEEF
jgi:hypothetical protein